MKKTTKMVICAALVASANLFAPAMPTDNVALSIVAPANVAYAATDEELTTAYREYKKTMIENDPYTPDEYKPAMLAEVSEYTVSNGYLLKNGQKVETLSSVVATFVAQGQAEEVFEKYDVFQKMVNGYTDEEIKAQFATKTALDGKADASTVSDLQTAVANKANTDDVNNALAGKADASTVTALGNQINGTDGLASQVGALQTRVTALQNSGGGVSQSALDAEATTRATKDVEHDQALADHETRITANTKAIAQEAATRAAVDKFLAESIDAEAETRAKADAQLQRNIEAEAYYRQQGDAQLNHRIDELSDRLNKTTAMTVAIAGLRLPEFNPNKKCTFAIGTGHYRSASAIAACMAYRPTSDISFSINFANSGSENTFSTSFAINF